MNRSILLSLIFTTWLFPLFAQEDPYDEADTSSAYTGFASVFFIPASIASDNVMYLGGIGSVLINDRIIVGGYGMRKTGNMYADRGALDGKRMSFGSAGLVGGYTFNITKRIKPVIQCFAGWGGLTFSETDSKGYAITKEFNRLGILAPSLSFDFNLFWYLWLSAGAEYMLVNGINADGYSNSDFSRPGAFLSIKLITGK